MKNFVLGLGILMLTTAPALAEQAKSNASPSSDTQTMGCCCCCKMMKAMQGKDKAGCPMMEKMQETTKSGGCSMMQEGSGPSGETEGREGVKGAR